METRANYALIGALVILAAAAMASFVLWLGQSEFRRDYKVYDIVFEGPVSLEEGAGVRYIGVKVGEVATVRIDKNDQSKVRVRIRCRARRRCGRIRPRRSSWRASRGSPMCRSALARGR